jgi:hypothetical protein
MQKFIDNHIVPVIEMRQYDPDQKLKMADKNEVFSSGVEEPTKLEHAWSSSDDITDSHIPELDGWDKNKRRKREVVEEESSSLVDMQALNATTVASA